MDPCVTRIIFRVLYSVRAVCKTHFVLSMIFLRDNEEMAIFTIIVVENRDIVSRKIKEQYEKGNYHETPDGYFFVNDSVTTKEVCEKVGLFSEIPPPKKPPEDQPVGFVIRSDHINGYYRESAWEWITSQETSNEL
ncbi:MAG: hypothetical protein KJO08_01140 [Gammaproteobacteria bacterium]|nr:hypothetical protein [Gammaproteobacteria bacterium]